MTEYVTFSQEPLTAADASFAVSFNYVLYHNAENGTKMTTGVVTTTPVVTLSLTVSATPDLGDVNGDGTVDALDAQMILDQEAQNLMQTLSVDTTDVSGDGIIDSDDAVLIAQYAEGKLEKFPAEE